MTVPSGPFLAERQQVGLLWAGRIPVKGCCRSRGSGRRPYLCVSSVPRGPRPILCKTLGGGGDRERDSHHRQGSTLSPASALGRDPRSGPGGGGKREYYTKLWPVAKEDLGTQIILIRSPPAPFLCCQVTCPFYEVKLTNTVSGRVCCFPMQSLLSDNYPQLYKKLGRYYWPRSGMKTFRRKIVNTEMPGCAVATEKETVLSHQRMGGKMASPLTEPPSRTSPIL